MSRPGGASPNPPFLKAQLLGATFSANRDEGSAPYLIVERSHSYGRFLFAGWFCRCNRLPWGLNHRNPLAIPGVWPGGDSLQAPSRFI